MRNPNGYGSIYKLSGKRRKPWAIRKTVGWDDNGKQLFKYVGYYTTRPEAIIALAKYNADPYDLNVTQITFKEVYEKWSEKKFPKISKSNVQGYTASFKTSEVLWDIKFVDLRKAHMQDVIDSCELGHGSRRKLKVLYNQLFSFAMENDIVTKDYASYVEVGPNESESDRNPFTKAEIDILWANVDRMDFIDTILVMIYTGMRPGEIITILNSNINFDNKTFKGGIKNASGKNRLIPICDKILPLVSQRYLESNEYFIVNHEGNSMQYWNYYEEKWKKIMEQLELTHRPHDCRHTFATLMDNAGANKLSIKRIMGHSSSDVTDKVYTHKDVDELHKAVALLN